MPFVRAVTLDNKFVATLSIAAFNHPAKGDELCINGTWYECTTVRRRYRPFELVAAEYNIEAPAVQEDEAVVVLSPLRL